MEVSIPVFIAILAVLGVGCVLQTVVKRRGDQQHRQALEQRQRQARRSAEHDG
jgi:uncharacterized protein HemX